MTAPTMSEEELGEIENGILGLTYLDMTIPVAMCRVIAALRSARAARDVARMTGEQAVIGAAQLAQELDELKAESLALRKAVEFYAEPLAWKDRVDVFGWGQGQRRVHVAPAKSDAGALARSALAAVGKKEGET